MIKLLVSDLDGTLLDHSKKVSTRELTALKHAREAGIRLCLASGRMHAEMQQVMEEIGFPAHSVSQNGAFIHLDNGTLLQSKQFQPEIAYQIYQMIKHYEMVKLICSGEANYIAARSEASDAIETRMFQPFLAREDAEEALLIDLPACKFSFFAPIDTLLQVKNEVGASLGHQVEMYISDKDCLDIMPLNVSKGSSLLVLLQELGIRPEEAACVGDSFNDVSMFGVTPHSFAMKGAHPEVRQAAAFQTGSVAEAVERVLAYNHERVNTLEKGSRPQ